MTQYRNTFEGGTAAAVLSAANLGGSSGDVPGIIVSSNGAVMVFDTLHPAHGVLGVKVSPTSTGAASLSYSGLSSNSVASRIYIYMTALPTADMYLIRHFSTGNVGILKFISTGALRILDSGGSTVWTSTVMPTGQIIRVDFFTDVGNNKISAAYSAGDGAATSDSGLLTAVLGGLSVARVDFGKVNGVYATDFWFDDIAADDAATGYLAPGAPAGALAGSMTIVPGSGTIPFSVTSTATVTGGTGTAKLYSWTWGDGGTTASQSSNIAAHTYTTAGAVVSGVTTPWQVRCTVVNT